MSRSNVKAALSIASVAVVAPFAVAGGAERPAVVTVRVWTGAQTPERATGTVVAPGRVLTVAHVLEGAKRVELAGGARARAATVIWRDAALDLVLLDVPGVTGPRVRFGDAEGDVRVITVSRAQAAGVRRRIMARLVDQPSHPRRPSLELAASVGAGDSGAPVFDTDGALVGVVYARSTRRGGTAYAVRVGRCAGLRPGCRQSQAR